MGQQTEQVRVDVKAAAKRSGMTLRRLSEVVCISYCTLRGIAYYGRLTGIETAYEITHATGELRIPGPKGTVVMRPEAEKERLPLRGFPLRCDAA